MPIHSFADQQTFTLPGIAHQTLAGARHGLKRTEIWLQTLQPGAVTPIHYHDCEEVIIILQGSGTLMMQDKPHAFVAGQTAIAPPKAVHQLINTGQDELRILATLSETPARAFLPDGSPFPLPWA